jgi:hypothetical protein
MMVPAEIGIIMSDNLSNISLNKSALRVTSLLTKLGLVFEVVELPSSIRTAMDASHAISYCDAQIAKLLVFKPLKQMNRYS